MGFTQSFQSWFKKILELIRGKVPVTQRFTVNNRQDFRNRMTSSTPCPVVLRQARGKLPGLVVPSAIHGIFRRITEGIPCSRKVNVCFSALQVVENNMTLASFLEHHEDPFREQDLHPMNIVDLDIGPHQRTMKHTFFYSKLDKRTFSGSYLHLKNGSLNPRRV